MNPVKPWLIKVLNGPNAGAQLLVSKEMAIGTSIDADLILTDPHIAPLHCLIKKREEEEAFDITPREGVVFINGTKVEEGTTALKLGDVLTLGSTHLTGGPSEQLWPPVTIPTLQEIGTVKEEVNSTEGASGEASREIPEEEKKQKKLLSTLSIVILIIVGSCIFMGLMLFQFVFHKNRSLSAHRFQPSSFEHQDEKVAALERESAESAAADLRKVFPNNYIKVVERGGMNVLYIYVSDQVQGDAVRRIMNEKAIPINANIINIDDIDDSAGAMSQAMNLALSVHVDGRTGKVVWTGYLPNQELLDSVKKQIERDLPAITDQEFRIVLGDMVLKMIRPILIKNHFDGIMVSPERQSVTLTGTVPIIDSARWEKTLKELEQLFFGKVKLVNMVTVTNAGINRGFFNAPVVSVSVSSFPYAVLQDGERIFLGAKVKDGYIVDSITPKGIGLINNGEKRMVPVAGQ